MSQILADVGFDHLNLWVSRPQRRSALRQDFWILADSYRNLARTAKGINVRILRVRIRHGEGQLCDLVLFFLSRIRRPRAGSAVSFVVAFSTVDMNPGDTSIPVSHIRPTSRAVRMTRLRSSDRLGLEPG